MKAPMVNPHPPGIAPPVIFIFVFVGVLFTVGIITTAVTFILPQGFTCTARISVQPDQPPPAPDPDFILTTCQIIRSPTVLNPVIESLDLNGVWGRKQPDGRTLKTSESLTILQQRLQLDSIHHAPLVDITVYSDEKLEAAQIANAIAGSYQDYRQKTYTGPKSSSPSALVQIIDDAGPSLAVPKPNIPLNITLGGVLGAILGLPLAGIAAFIAARNRNRKQQRDSII